MTKQRYLYWAKKNLTKILNPSTGSSSIDHGQYLSNELVAAATAMSAVSVEHATRFISLLGMRAPAKNFLRRYAFDVVYPVLLEMWRVQRAAILDPHRASAEGALPLVLQFDGCHSCVRYSQNTTVVFLHALSRKVAFFHAMNQGDPNTREATGLRVGLADLDAERVDLAALVMDYCTSCRAIAEKTPRTHAHSLDDRLKFVLSLLDMYVVCAPSLVSLCAAALCGL